MGSLTATAIRNLDTPTKPRKVFDGGGLHLLLTPAGGRLWRLKFRSGGKEKLLALGSWPAVSLADARRAADDAKRLLAQGDDPAVAKRDARESARAKPTFAVMAAELIAKAEAEGRAEATVKKLRWYAELVAKDLGGMMIADIKAPQILFSLRRIEGRGHHETATNAREFIGRVIRFAIAGGLAETDPTLALRGALVTPKVRHRPAFTDPVNFGGLLRAIWGFKGQPETVAALKLLALLAPRPGELRLSEWSEFDLDLGVWDIPEMRTKMRRPHRVLLPPQAVQILRELREVSRPSPLVFPGTVSAQRPISENTLNAALRRMGYGADEVTPHGFRASFSSMANEAGLWSADAIERHLAHQEPNAVRRAYARGQHLDERWKLSVWWADRCDELRTSV